MPTLNVLVTSCFGLYGKYICNALKQNSNVVGLYRSNFIDSDFKTINIDITNFDKLKEIILIYKPNFIIHNAAISNPQLADALDPKLVYTTNVIASEKIAEFANLINSRLIFISTDLVYAGYRGSYLKENAKLIPASLYAETKLMAEEKIKAKSNNFTILRNSLMFGLFNKPNNNFFNQTYHKLKNKEKVNLFYDQFRTPLSFEEGAKLISKLLEMMSTNSNTLLNQTINFGGKERISRTEMGYILCDLMDYDKNLINSLSIKEFPNIPIVEDVSMNIDIIKSLGLEPLSVKEMIKNEVEKIKFETIK